MSENDPVPDLGGTVLVERRSAADLLAGFLVAMAGLAAWRGWEQSRAAAWVAVGVGIVVTGFWAARRARPAARLTIAPATISLRRGTAVEGEAFREPASTVRITRNRSGAFLRVDGSRPVVLGLLGFDLREVGRACMDAGWRFDV